jgi:hypothetical protein
MNRLSILSSLMLTALGLMLTANSGVAQSAKDLVGTWTVVTAEAYGANPKGSLNFDANGRFTLILMRSDLPKFASNNRIQGTPAEYKTVAEGILAYFGSYSVSETDLNLHIDGSTFPNWTGMDQKRTNLAVTADELKYTQPTPSGGGPAIPLVWKRIK